MVAANDWPPGAPETGTHYFRAGEVFVLVEPLESGGRRGAAPDRAELAEVERYVEGLCREVGIDLDPRAAERKRDSDPLVLPRAGGRTLYLHTITLYKTPPPEDHPPEVLAPAMRAALDAVERLNPKEEVTPAQGQRFRIVAATPNWLALPFHW